MANEITLQALDPRQFIAEKVRTIRETVGEGIAFNALSGGVDSSTVTLLGHQALGNRLKTVFIENGLMREGEAEQVVGWFRALDVAVEVIDARDEFFAALAGITDPEEKREAITQTFYRQVFGRLVKASGANFLLQGTILTDIDETIAGSNGSTMSSNSSGSILKKPLGIASSNRSSSFARTACGRLARRSGFLRRCFRASRFPDRPWRHG